MLKKSIWVFLHLLATIVLAVSLIVGVFLLHQYNYTWSCVRENVSYEFSGALANDLWNESEFIWEYFYAKQIVAEYEEEPQITVEDIYHLLQTIGFTEKDLQVLDEQYGLTEEGLYSFFADNYSVAEERVQSYLSEQKADKSEGETDENTGLETASELESLTPEEYEQAQSTCILGDSRFNPEYTNIRYTISYGGEYVDSNLPVEEISLKSQVYEQSIDGYELEVYLNANYPAEDYYSQASVAYNQLQSWKWVYFGCIFGALLLIFVALVLLTRYAGRVKGQDGISLSWIDKPPLELTLIFWGGIAVCICYVLVISARYCSASVSYFWFVIFCLAVLLGDAFALAGYLSLVRRIKSHTLGRNSIVYRIGAAFARMIRNLLNMTRVSQKILIACGFYIIFMLLLSMIGGRVSILLAVFISIIGLLIVYRDAIARQEILDGMEKITSGELDYQINLEKINHLQMEVARAANQVGSAMKTAVEQSLKDERLKADLITNVSHDIKTPLTSIINYVDLLKREDIQNEKAQGYLEILDQKSQRLKQLTEDLVEASKLSSGNVVLNMERMDFNEILQQALGEFEEKFASKDLVVVLKRPEGRVMVMGEGRRIWRVLENLFQNVYKYAMPGTRVYVELQKELSEMIFTLKNISQYPLNINAGELTERFIRGDISRTTEGSGLGLSIARDLTTLQQGGFDIHLDGDLFKVTLKFELIE